MYRRADARWYRWTGWFCFDRPNAPSQSPFALAHKRFRHFIRTFDKEVLRIYGLRLWTYDGLTGSANGAKIMLTTLISNIRKLTKDSKESYFGKRWSAVAGLNKQIDRGGYEFEEVDQCAPARELSNHFINRYRYRNLPADFVTFVDRLRDDSISFVAEQRGMRLQQIERMAMLNAAGVELLNTIYQNLAMCAMELNNTLGFSELNIVMTAPQFVTEAVTFSKARQPLQVVTYYRARLATPTFSLVLRAKEGTMEFFVLPTIAVLGLSKMESAYPCVASLTANLENDTIEWEIDRKPLTGDRIKDLSMVIFRQLMEKTRMQFEMQTFDLAS
jgi:hypothetical protein